LKFFVYVLLSRSRPKRTYVGWTVNLELRVARHNAGSGAKFTRGRKWTLIYAERHASRSAAMRREVQLKKDRAFRTLLRAR
jgi:putative endonuclease